MQDQNRLPENLTLSDAEDDKERSGRTHNSTTQPFPIVIHSDKFETWGKIASAAFTLIAIFLAIMEYSESTDQRIKELRFQQAQVGKGLLDQVFASEEAQDAMRMLDHQDTGMKFQVTEGEPELIKTSDIIQALNSDEDTPPDKVVFIQERIDTLLFFIGRIQSFIEIDMVNEEDVLYPLEYYAHQMCDYKDDISTYITTYSSKQTQTFLNNRWKDCAQTNK
ncbi:MAG TPA: hypothetical protein VGD58_10360 [Herpetosiphonaceae bacterium]